MWRALTIVSRGPPRSCVSRLPTGFASGRPLTLNIGRQPCGGYDGYNYQIMGAIVLAREIRRRMKRPIILVALAVASHIAPAAQSALEEEVVTMARALSPSAPTSNGKGSYLLGSQAKGKTLEVRVKIQPELKDWRRFWQNNVCSDPSTRRILAMGGAVAIQAQDSDNKPLGALAINLKYCGALGMPITTADTATRSTEAPAPPAPIRMPGR